MDTNPANRSDYVQCLKEIGDMRRSEDLQTKAAIAESLTTDAPFNQFILSTYAEALSFLNAQDNTSDEFIWTLMTAKVRWPFLFMLETGVNGLSRAIGVSKVFSVCVTLQSLTLSL